jgi:hypothetical protein
MVFGMNTLVLVNALILPANVLHLRHGDTIPLVVVDALLSFILLLQREIFLFLLQ